jgi:hypothetical protein
VGNSASLMADIVAIYMDEVALIQDAVGIVPSCVFQPITSDMISHFTKNGGNALGLDGQGPINCMLFSLLELITVADDLLVINIDISWSDSSDDDRIIAAAQNIVDRSAAAAEAMGLSNIYLYQNYASYQQNVFAGYGEANLERLQAVSAKYDPTQVWQKLQPGYFKL